MSCLEAVGIDIQSGLSYCQGDMEFYSQLLSSFAQDAARKEKEMNNFFKQGALENYCILVHALKSTAKMVGAASLSEMARLAEEAAKKHDAGYIREHHEELITKYHEIVQRILDVLDCNENASIQETRGGCMELSRDELLQRLAELKDSLGTFEADRAQALISEMSSAVYQGTAIGGLLDAARRDVADFEFGAASEKVEAFIDSVEGGEV